MGIAIVASEGFDTTKSKIQSCMHAYMPIVNLFTYNYCTCKHAFACGYILLAIHYITIVATIILYTFLPLHNNNRPKYSNSLLYIAAM